jgi:hypothetical protein
MKKITLVVLWAALIVALGARSASAQAVEFNICTSLQGGGTQNFRATVMNTASGTAGTNFSLVVVSTGSVNAIGVGAMNFNANFLAPLTLNWTIITDNATEHYNCSLFAQQLSGLGNLLTVRNIGTTRVQLSPCSIKVTPC